MSRRRWLVHIIALAPIVVGTACSSFATATAPSSPDPGADASLPTDAASTSDVPNVPDVFDGGETRPALPTQGLAAYWKFDDNGTDSSGNQGQEMELTGATFVPGISGKALHCGPNDYAVTTSASGTFDIGTGDATFLGWVKLDQAALDTDQTTHRTILFKTINWTSKATTTGGYGLGYSEPNPSFGGAIGDGTKWSSVSGSSSASLIDGTFHMFAFVVAGTLLKIYIDGVFVNSSNATRDASISHTPPADPLTLCSVHSHPLRGALDELMIFNRALPTEEIVTVRKAITGL